MGKEPPKPRCLDCGEIQHEGDCDPQLKEIWQKALTLQELIDLPEGGKFLYKGQEAGVVWKEKTRWLISKGDPAAKPPTADAYFRNDSVCFRLANQELVTLSSCFPVPKLLKLKQECERL